MKKGKTLAEVFAGIDSGLATDIEETLNRQITRERNVAIFAYAVKTFGVHAQLAKAVEECAELIVAIQHFLCDRHGSTREVMEEMADVAIMIGQLRIMFDDETFRLMRAEKIERLKHRIIEEGNKNGKVVLL